MYDELNRLADKRLHASNYDGINPVALGASFNYLQSLDYAYNIRGWLTGINDAASCALQGGDQLADLFNMSLDYESTANGATAQFNGNIAAMQWRTNVNGSCLTRQQYRFTYDYANRLLTANHFTHNGAGWVNTNNYSESNISYDLNGNIKSYTRRGLTAPATFGVIDQLTYTYGDAARPDRLTNVSDAGSAAKGFKFTSGAAAYTYDLNGNLTQDNHKSLSFQYNYLNLPNYITNPGGSEITITYTADGEKLTKTTPTETRNYVSGIEYLGNALDAIYHGEGRCTPNGASAFYYEYTIKDHLGNARINFRANGTAVTFLQELHYYPFGMLMEGIGTAPVTNNGYKYNGKELNEDLGLNLSDYGARWYDASLGRWWSVDPLGEKSLSTSTYAYVSNNPMILIDPNGMESEAYNFANNLEKYSQQNEQLKKEMAERGRGDIVKKSSPYPLPKLYLANEAGLNSKQVYDIGDVAATILHKNGYVGLSIELVSSKTAKKFNNGYPNQMFLALIKANEDIDPGNSNVSVLNGTIGVYFESNAKDPTHGWASYVNVNDAKIQRHHDKIYATGFMVAHEIVHQMLGISAHYSGQNLMPLDHDNNGVNLMNRGAWLTIPSNRSKSNALHDAERIPETFRKHLDPFYLTPSARIR